MSAIVVDLGGTHLRCAVSDEYGDIGTVKKVRIGNFLHGYQSDVIWEGIISSIMAFEASVRSEVPINAPIVISFPGPIGHDSRILDAPTVTGKLAALPDLKTELADRTGRHVHIINDISAAAWHFSREIPASRFIVVTVSSGIGSKIFDKNHPLGVIDNVPYAGELGHAVIDNSPDALDCDCGGRGHLGAISSGRGIERTARRQALLDPAGFASSICVTKYRASCDTLTNENHLVPSALEGDAWVLQIIRGCTTYLARTLIQVVLAIGIEKIVIIGGFALALGETYLRIFNEELVKVCDYSVLRGYVTGLSVLGNQDEEACLKGAAVFAKKLSDTHQ